MDKSTIENAVDEWRGRLLACARENGGHFEQPLRVKVSNPFSHVSRNISFLLKYDPTVKLYDL